MARIVETKTRWHLDDDEKLVLIEFVNTDGEVIQITPEDMLAGADLYAREHTIDVLANRIMADSGIDPNNPEARAEVKEVIIQTMPSEELEGMYQSMAASLKQMFSGNGIMDQSTRLMKMAKLAHERSSVGVS